MLPDGYTDSSISEEESFRQLIARHVTHHPKLEAQDLYKLVHQATFGSEHAATNVSQARAWLEREVEELTEGSEEPALEPISGDGRIVRVNLRPYLAGGGDLELLLKAFMRTAKEYKGTVIQLKRYWRYMEQMAEDGTIGLEMAELKSFFREMETQGFPAVHHSEAYRGAYRPAYRVVVRKYLDQ